MLDIKRAEPKGILPIEEIVLKENQFGRTITVKPSNIWWPERSDGKFGLCQGGTHLVVVVSRNELRAFAEGLLELAEQ